jgi:hypothetical protein
LLSIPANIWQQGNSIDGGSVIRYEAGLYINRTNLRFGSLL